MRYLPHTEEEVAAMLRVVGVATLDDLFATVPEDCRMGAPLELPDPLTEWELGRHMGALADTVAAAPRSRVFLGAGSYEHFIPATVPSLVGRSEFTTAYTPYQPEISQGTLQALFEYQTLVSRLLGMEVANASMYDGASALIEALLMAIRVTKRKTVAVSRAVHPAYRSVVNTYLEPSGFEVIELPYDDSGRTDLAGLEEVGGLAAVALQSPNFFGCVEDLAAAAEVSRGAGALFTVAFTEALAYGLLKNPGESGADIACGEGQSLGIAQSFGGPYLGVFTTREQYTRNLPGRLVGKTVDREARVGFVLTLATREQHIRREKATSNICSNQSLLALSAAVYLASLGKHGLRELARLNYDKAEYLKGRLREAGLRLRFSGPTFNEFVVEFPPGSEARYQDLLGEGIVPGLPLAPYYSDLENCYLLCVTEAKTKEDLDALVKGIAR
jgi:glycine dehydrogenase subunit 1